MGRRLAPPADRGPRVKSSVELGLQGLLLGMSFCFDEEFEEQPAKNTYAVLSYCYAADLLRSCPEPFVTIAYGRGSARCTQIIAFQKSLIELAAV